MDREIYSNSLKRRSFYDNIELEYICVSIRRLREKIDVRASWLDGKTVFL